MTTKRERARAYIYEHDDGPADECFLCAEHEKSLTALLEAVERETVGRCAEIVDDRGFFGTADRIRALAQVDSTKTGG